MAALVLTAGTTNDAMMVRKEYGLQKLMILCACVCCAVCYTEKKE